MSTEDHLAGHHLTRHKAADTLELFFDLVFVFAITQVVYTLAHDLTWEGAARAAILLGVLWWGWTGWAWTTNLVDLTPRWRRVVMLGAMASTLVMAHAVPKAFEGEGLWVAIPYLIMTQMGSMLLLQSTKSQGESVKGLLKFAPISALGGALLVIGAIADANQEWIWLGAVLLTVLASELGGREPWAIVPSHYAERHGLILIIALGEAIIAVGVTLARGEETPPSWRVASFLLIGISYAMTLYWGYFDRANGIWEESMKNETRETVGRYAVHVYAWTHFPMIVGIVFSAVTLEEVFLHPDDHLHTFVNHIFAIAIVSFFGAMAAGAWRANKVILTERLLAIAASLLVIYGLPDLNGRAVVTVVISILIAAFTAEHFRLNTTSPKTANPTI